MLRSNYRTRRRLSFVCALLRTESKQYTPCRAIAQTNLNVQTETQVCAFPIRAVPGLRRGANIPTQGRGRAHLRAPDALGVLRVDWGGKEDLGTGCRRRASEREGLTCKAGAAP